MNWRISAYAIAKNEAGQFLMVQSSEGLWLFPGGGLEIDEDLANGAQRECLEETGYKIKTRPGVVHTNEQFFYHRREDAFYHSLQLFLLADLVAKVPDMSFVRGHDAERMSAWIDTTRLQPSNFHDTVREIITSGSVLKYS